MKRILIIEDQEDILDDLKIILEKNGFAVLCASNGELGLKVAQQAMPDLIISDIMLPGIDGYSILEALNQEEKTSMIPFIFLTAKAEITDLRKGMELGADDYIFKPYDADDLIAAINVRLKKNEKLKKGIIHSLIDTPENEKGTMSVNDRIYIAGKNGAIPIKLSNIVYLRAENQYSRIYCENKRHYLIRKSLNKWNDILLDCKFLRIHRSYIINLSYIKAIVKGDRNNYSVHMDNYEDSLEIARKYVKSFKKATLNKYI